MKWSLLLAAWISLASVAWAQPALDVPHNIKSMTGTATTADTEVPFGLPGGAYSLAVAVANLDASNVLWVKMGAATCAAASPATPIDPANRYGITADISTNTCCMVTTSGTANYQIDILY